jgi:hypothetical protein
MRFMKIVIAGYGYLGSALGKHLAAEGWEVEGLKRTVDAAGQALGVFACDFTKPETLKTLPSAAYAVFSQAPSKETDDYESTYLRGTENLLAALKDKISKRIILISSTSVYGQRDGAWVDETTDPAKDGYENDDAAKKAGLLLGWDRLASRRDLWSRPASLGRDQVRQNQGDSDTRVGQSDSDRRHRGCDPAFDGQGVSRYLPRSRRSAFYPKRILRMALPTDRRRASARSARRVAAFFEQALLQ